MAHKKQITIMMFTNFLLPEPQTITQNHRAQFVVVVHIVLLCHQHNISNKYHIIICERVIISGQGQIYHKNKIISML